MRYSSSSCLLCAESDVSSSIHLSSSEKSDVLLRMRRALANSPYSIAQSSSRLKSAWEARESLHLLGGIGFRVTLVLFFDQQSPLLCFIPWAKPLEAPKLMKTVLTCTHSTPFLFFSLQPFNSTHLLLRLLQQRLASVLCIVAPPSSVASCYICAQQPSQKKLFRWERPRDRQIGTYHGASIFRSLWKSRVNSNLLMRSGDSFLRHMTFMFSMFLNVMRTCPRWLAERAPGLIRPFVLLAAYPPQFPLRPITPEVAARCPKSGCHPFLLEPHHHSRVRSAAVRVLHVMLYLSCVRLRFTVKNVYNHIMLLFWDKT